MEGGQRRLVVARDELPACLHRDGGGPPPDVSLEPARGVRIALALARRNGVWLHGRLHDGRLHRIVAGRLPPPLRRLVSQALPLGVLRVPLTDERLVRTALAIRFFL